MASRTAPLSPLAAPWGAWADRVLRACAEHYKVHPALVTGVRRTALIAEARHVAAACLRAGRLSYPEIGLVLGGRDHSTIISAVRRVERTPRLVNEMLAVLDKVGPRDDDDGRHQRGEQREPVGPA